MELPIIEDPAGAKLAWAYQHLKELDLQIVAFVNRFREGEAYEIVRMLDRDSGEEVHRLKLVRPVPLTQWGLLVGEVVHLTRSTLDNLVERLTIQNLGRSIEASSFPICTSREQFAQVSAKAAKRGLPTRNSGLYKIQGLTEEQRAIVEAVQPYKSGDDDLAWRTNALWIIHELWNMDKHRTPPIGVSGAFAANVAFTSGLTRSAAVALKFPLEDGAELARFVAMNGQTEPNMRVQSRIIPQITFDEASPGFGRPLVATLDWAHIAVSKIVTSLDPTTTMEIVATEID